MISITTAPNAAVRIKEGDLKIRKRRALIYLEKTKKKTGPCARYARGLSGD